MENVAFIDGQNLHLSTKRSETPWKVDLFRFYEYLKKKYKVAKACYFIGCYERRQEKLYADISDAGFEIVFREHDPKSHSAKKGNVDTDIVCLMLSGYITGEYKDKKVVLVSGDGDYYRTVKFLIEQKLFYRVLLPSKKNMSGLYKTLPQRYRVLLDDKDVKRKIEYKK